MALITLDNQQLRLVLDPDQGVNVMAFYVQQRGRWLPVMPDVRATGGDPKASSFVMLPYSNRIEQGRFTFAGQSYQLAHGERHASHGDTRTRPWRVDRASRTQIHCTFDSPQHEQVNWPWPFTATLEYRLEGLALISQISLTNWGDSPMPAGTGWHPYFNRTLTQANEPLEVQFKVASVYPDANDNRIPSGPAEPLAGNQDFSTPKLLTPTNFIDCCFTGYDGQGYFAWPASGVKVTYQTVNCSHLVFFNPPKPYFAMEPVTNANNGVNLLAQGDPTSGIRVLEPGGALVVRFTMQLELS